jgi:hypothetical protein
MDTSSSTPARSLTSQTISVPSSAVRLTWSKFSPWLHRRARLVAMLSVAAIALTTAWLWFGAEAVRPLLYVLPCAAMMAVCMRGHGASSSAVPGDTPPNANTPT